MDDICYNITIKMNIIKKYYSIFCKRSYSAVKFIAHIKGLLLLFIILSNSCTKDNTIPEPIALPAKYDLREYGFITPVRNQNGTKSDGSSDMGSTVGLCWAFSSLASLESNMLKLGITNSPLSSEASLSPWYLGNYIGLNKPCYEFNSDTIPGLTPPMTFGYYFPTCGWGGGGAFWTGDYLISGNELPSWDDCPMPTLDQNAHNTLQAPATQTTKKYNIAKMPIIFSSGFPGINDYIKNIKNYIYENGAIQSIVHLEALDIQGSISQIINGIEYTGSRFMDKQNFNMYTYDTENLGTQLLTHCVTIAGWDDNRMINVNGHTATGAWLIKDSQSETSWDEGYFWVAYDDIVINTISSGLIACNETNYEHQSKYQTHPGILSNLSEFGQQNEETCLKLGEYGYLFNGSNTENSWGVAEFPLNSDETLAAVGAFSSNRNQKINIHIYKNNLNSNALHIQDFTLDEVGYHMLKLNHEIEFRSNETMIIAVEFKHGSFHTRLPLCYVQDNNCNFDYSTFFGTREEGVFQLQPYSSIIPKSAFFLQAIIKK